MRLEGVFTKQERAALGFVIGVGLLGMVVQALRLDRPPVQGYQPRPAVAVNRATAEELTALPGIGPVLARRILADRKLHGRYLTLTDLSRAKGVTPKTLEKLKGMLRFD